MFIFIYFIYNTWFIIFYCIINKIFKLSDFDSYVWAQGKPEIIIHELVSSKIFNQVPGSLTDAINCNINDLTIVPGEYGCDIFSVNINKNVFDKIVNQSKQVADVHTEAI